MAKLDEFKTLNEVELSAVEGGKHCLIGTIGSGISGGVFGAGAGAGFAATATAELGFISAAAAATPVGWAIGGGVVLGAALGSFGGYNLFC